MISAQDVFDGHFSDVASSPRPEQYDLANELANVLRTKRLNEAECCRIGSLMKQLAPIPRLIVWSALTKICENLYDVHKLVEQEMLHSVDTPGHTRENPSDSMIELNEWLNCDRENRQEVARKFGYVL